MLLKTLIINYVNIIFAIGLKLLDTAEKIGLDFPGSVKADLISWFGKKITTKMAEFKAQAGVGTNLLEWLVLKLKIDSGFRQEIKQEYANNVSELVEKIHEIAGRMFDNEYDLALAVMEGMKARSEAGNYHLERFIPHSALLNISFYFLTHPKAFSRKTFI